MIKRNKQGQFIKGSFPICSFKKGHIINVGKKLSEETKRKIGKANMGHQPMLGKKHTEETKKKMRESRLKNLVGYKAIWIKEYRKPSLKEWRHKKGISKNYNSQTTGIKFSKKQQNQIYKRRVRVGGKLPLERLQRIYEDNIKKYGTLTCYLCLKSIEFGQDSLEHKIPLSRGGTNLYENLAIACRNCNSKKYNKTEKEYKEREG